MELPFSHDDFLDVFGAYNAALWPVAAILWICTAWLFVRGWRHGAGQRSLLALLAVHWMWAGVAYHWFFFRSINPAATLFGAVFLVQALFFLWLAAASRGQLATGGIRRALGGTLVLYGLMYPAVGVALGLQYPRMPVFAVPCPTALVTAGVLLMTVGIPRFVNVIPILWGIVGGSAALVLGIRADVALLVVAGLLGLDTVAPSLLVGRRESP
jgi:hypothetical protein